jgi:hypothetical protein
LGGGHNTNLHQPKTRVRGSAWERALYVAIVVYVVELGSCDACGQTIFPTTLRKEVLRLVFLVRRP